MKKIAYSRFNQWGIIIAMMAVLALVLALQLPYINEFPAYIHAWAQADWYSIAIGYIDNGMDFFHPETSIYNKQFPGHWAVANATTITSVDFPIHEYIVALWMKLFGTTAPWVFRLWTLIISLIGMFFLYKVSFELSHDWLKSLLVVSVAVTAPVYAYYFSGFLPAIPAIAVATAGLWAYLKYRNTNALKYFHWSVGLLTLAMLIRTTFAIAFIATLGFEFLRILRKESTLKGKIPTVAIAIILYLSYYLWNAHLRASYGSLFLNELMPAKSKEDWTYVFENIQERWLYHYFQISQQHLIATAAAIGLLWAIGRALYKHFRGHEKSQKALSFWWFCGIYLFGCLLFGIAMLKQYTDHDYYFIDSFFLPLLLILTAGLAELPKIKNYWIGLLVLGLIVWIVQPMYMGAHRIQKERRIGEDTAQICAQHFNNSEQFLNEAGVAPDAKILVFFGYPQNSPFILMRRKGYCVMWHDYDIVHNAIEFDYDYIVIEKDAFRDNFEGHNDILQHLKPIKQNEFLTLCAYDKTHVNESIENFLSI